MYMYVQKKLTGLKFAFTGLRIAWQEELNFRFKAVFASLTLFFSFYLHLPKTELLIIILLAGLVLSSEILNTAIEKLCDKFQPAHDPYIEKVKDLGAAAVFISTLSALIAGAIIFIPYIVQPA